MCRCVGGCTKIGTEPNKHVTLCPPAWSYMGLIVHRSEGICSHLHAVTHTHNSHPHQDVITFKERRPEDEGVEDGGDGTKATEGEEGDQEDETVYASVWLAQPLRVLDCGYGTTIPWHP